MSTHHAGSQSETSRIRANGISEHHLPDNKSAGRQLDTGALYADPDFVGLTETPDFHAKTPQAPICRTLQAGRIL